MLQLHENVFSGQKLVVQWNPLHLAGCPFYIQARQGRPGSLQATGVKNISTRLAVAEKRRRDAGDTAQRLKLSLAKGSNMFEVWPWPSKVIAFGFQVVWARFPILCVCVGGWVGGWVHAAAQ